MSVLEGIAEPLEACHLFWLTLLTTGRIFFQFFRSAVLDSITQTCQFLLLLLFYTNKQTETFTQIEKLFCK